MIKNNWILLNAKDKILGRFASKIATMLMGKNNINYAPNKITGHQIIVINSKKIKITGNKFKNKKYYKYSGYPGGLKITNFQKIIEKNPNFIIQHAVKGMLPKNKLQKIFLKRLKIYKDDAHPHSAQNPKLMEI